MNFNSEQIVYTCVGKVVATQLNLYCVGKSGGRLSHTIAQILLFTRPASVTRRDTCLSGVQDESGDRIPKTTELYQQHLKN